MAGCRSVAPRPGRWRRCDARLPAGLPGIKTLTNFKYRNSKLKISVEGVGDTVEYMTLDGKRMPSASIPANLQGSHIVIVQMRPWHIQRGSVNLVKVVTSPGTPQVSVIANGMRWLPVPGAVSYEVFRNGKEIAKLHRDRYEIPKGDGYAEYQVLAVDARGKRSFLCEPVVEASGIPSMIVQAEGETNAKHEVGGYTVSGYVEVSGDVHDTLTYHVSISSAGIYAVDFRYANGNGPITTENKCAIRTLQIDGRTIGTVVLPQRGDGDWQNWGFSNALHIDLGAGEHTVVLYFDRHDNNMNGAVNSALIDEFRLTRIAQWLSADSLHSCRIQAFDLI